MRFFFARTKLAVALMGVLFILMGIIVLSDPVGTTVLITRIAGIVCALFGLVSLFDSARLEGGLSSVSAGSLIVGGLPLAFGLIVALFPDAFVSLIFTIFGIGVLLTGIGDIARAREVRQSHVDDGRLSMIVGIATVLLGVVVIVSPLAVASLVPTVAAIALIVDGASELFLAFNM